MGQFISGLSQSLCIEVVIIGLVILFQISVFRRTIAHIKKLQKIFTEPLRLISRKITAARELIDDESEGGNDSENTRDIFLLKSESKNRINIDIKESINTYLINNYGATVNYSIIKNIIEREIDAKDEEISQTIPMLLYLGLIGTVVGIIAGLFAINLTSNNLASIQPLINRVVIAMVATLSGIFLTIWSSWRYNNAKKAILKAKNKQLTYLQAHLLPELIKAEDAGAIGLKSSIDQFSRKAESMISELHTATEKSESNIVKQQQTLDRIEDLNVTKVSKVNLELFNKLENNMEAFQEFSEYIDKLGDISSNLHEFSERTENMESIANEIKTTLDESKKLSQFLTNHLKVLDEAGDNALQAVDESGQQFAKIIEKLSDSTDYIVDMSEEHFSDSVESLSNKTEQNIKKLEDLSDNIEYRFNQLFEELTTELKKVSQHHVESLTDAYTENTPAFEKLDHLTELEVIKNELSKISEASDLAHSDLEGNNENLESTLKKLAEITQLLSSIDNKTTSGNGRRKSTTKIKSNGKKASSWKSVKNWFKKPFN